MKTATTSLTNLKPIDSNKEIEANVYRKWITKNVPEPTPQDFVVYYMIKRYYAQIHVKDTILE